MSTTEDMLEQLKPIAAIMGPTAVSASYSDTKIHHGGSYYAGWEVTVKGTYKGASISLSRTAATLDEAAGGALSQLKNALGLS